MAQSIDIPVDININYNDEIFKQIREDIKELNKTDSDGFNKSLKTAKNSAKALDVILLDLIHDSITLSDRLVSAFSTVGKVLTSTATAGLKLGTSLVTGLAGSIAKITKALVALGVVDYGKNAIEQASNIAEYGNVIDTVFGESNATIAEFTNSTRELFNLTEQQALKFVGTFGSIGSASGLAGKDLETFSINLSKLSGDIASFYDLDAETAFTKLTSAISGETEPLRALGVNMTVANLEAYALSQGITTAFSSMSQAEQTALRYNYILESLSMTMGDFVKTQSSWSNQVKTLQNTLSEIATVIGNILIQVFYPLLTIINQIASAALSAVKAVYALFGQEIDLGVDSSGISSTAGDYDDITDSIDDATDAQDKLNSSTKKYLASIHNLNVLQSPTTTSSSSNSSGSSGGVSSSGLNIDLSPYKDLNSELDQTKTKFEEILDLLQNGEFYAAGTEIANTLNAALQGVDLSQYEDNVRSAVSNIVAILNGFIDNIDTSQWGLIFSDGVNLIIAGAYTAVSEFHWDELGLRIYEFLSTSISNINWIELGQTIGTYLSGIFTTGFNAIGGIDGDLISTFGESLRIMLNNAISSFSPESVGEAIAGLVNGISGYIANLFGEDSDGETLGTKLGEWFSTAVNTFATNWNAEDSAGAINALVGSITDFVVAVLENVDWDLISEKLGELWEDLDPTTKNVITAGLGLIVAAEFGKIIIKVLKFITVINNLGTLIKGIGSSTGTVIKGIGTVIKGIGTVIKGVGSGIGTIASSIATVFSKFGTLIGGIAGVISGVVTYIGGFVEAWNAGLNVINAIKIALGVVITAVSAVVLGASAGIAALIAAIVAAITYIVLAIHEHWEEICDFFEGVWDSICEFFENLVNWVVEKFNELKENLIEVFNNIRDKVSEIITNITEFFSNLLNAAKEKFNELKTIVEEKFNAIKEKISEIVENIKLAIEEKFNAIKEKISEIIENIKLAVEEKFTLIHDKISEIIENIKTFIEEKFTWIHDKISEIIDNIKLAVEEKFNLIKDTLSNIIDNIKTVVGEKFNLVKNKVSEIFTNIKLTVEELFGKVHEFITEKIDLVSDKFNGLKDTISLVFTNIRDTIKSVINTVIRFINKLIEGLNKIVIKDAPMLPDFDGLKIPTIPELAKGAVIPPNNAFLAILGDQKSGVNIETPLSTMVDAFRMALASDNYSNDSGDIIIPIYINNELSTEEIIRRQDIARYRSNGK